MTFWRRNMPHEIWFRVPTKTRDSNGDLVATNSKTKTIARVEIARDLLRGPDNTEIVTSHRIYVPIEIPMSSTLWVPFLGDDPGDDNKGRHPVAVTGGERLRGGGAAHRLFVVYL